MPPKLGTPYSPTWGGWPPHMSDKDFQLWRRLTLRQPYLAQTYYYDVKLGNGAPVPATPSTPMTTAWQDLTSYRADVIGDTGDAWLLIELRDNASPSALGALLCYDYLWKADPPDDRPSALWLVTNQVHPDLPPILRHYAIHLELV